MRVVVGALVFKYGSVGIVYVDGAYAVKLRELEILECSSYVPIYL